MYAPLQFRKGNPGGGPGIGCFFSNWFSVLGPPVPPLSPAPARILSPSMLIGVDEFVEGTDNFGEECIMDEDFSITSYSSN
jgi:hypothetical protein